MRGVEIEVSWVGKKGQIEKERQRVKYEGRERWKGENSGGGAGVETAVVAYYQPLPTSAKLALPAPVLTVCMLNTRFRVTSFHTVVAFNPFPLNLPPLSHLVRLPTESRAHEPILLFPPPYSASRRIPNMLSQRRRAPVSSKLTRCLSHSMKFPPSLSLSSLSLSLHPLSPPTTVT